LIPELRKIIEYARNFAQVIHGAVLLYNLMLAKAQKNDELIDSYIDQIKAWASDMGEHEAQLLRWSSEINKFWECESLKYASIPHPTKQFVESWCTLVFGKYSPETISESAEARDLIKFREMRLKRNRARLENSRYLELWSGSSGVGMLGYRWRQVSKIVQDVRKGLGFEDP
jgi:hypothetical protein